MPNRIVAIVGMPGAGKSEVSALFEQAGYTRIRFGDATDAEVARRGLQLSEENERFVREELRRELGMAAYAIVNLPRIDAALDKGDVVVDGLYSWEEYLALKERYGDGMVVLAVSASPALRARRLGARPHRPLTPDEVASRDRSEIERINKGGPIAMADITVVNNGTLEVLREKAMSTLKELA